MEENIWSNINLNALPFLCIIVGYKMLACFCSCLGSIFGESSLVLCASLVELSLNIRLFSFIHASTVDHGQEN